MNREITEKKDIIVNNGGFRINMTLYAKVLEAKILTNQPILFQNIKFNRELFKLNKK